MTRAKTRPRLWTGRGRAALAALALSTLIAASAAASRATPLLINESSSLPRGVYVLWPDEVERGSTVALPQPVAARAYLSGLGMPSQVLLIKRVAAMGGDSVCSDGQRLISPQGVRAVQARDRQGAALPRWSGCRRLQAHELFLLGDTAGSFDSRYFGPVDRSRVRGVYREVMTW